MVILLSMRSCATMAQEARDLPSQAIGRIICLFWIVVKGRVSIFAKKNAYAAFIAVSVAGEVLVGARLGLDGRVRPWQPVFP